MIFLFLLFNLYHQCEVTDSEGYIYDLNYLSTDDWGVIETGNSNVYNKKFTFNFCKNTAQTCRGDYNLAMYTLELINPDQTNKKDQAQFTPEKTCKILGKTMNPTVKQMEQSQGVIVTYDGGEICKYSENPNEVNKQMKIHFAIYCRETQDEKFDKVIVSKNIWTTRCNMEFSINSPSGCKTMDFSITFYGFLKQQSILFQVI